MKIGKKALALVLAFALVAGMAPLALAADDDVAGHWAEGDLREWISLGLLGGYGDGSYRPDGSITRAEFIKLINSVKGYTDQSDEVSRYADVKPGAWYHGEVSAALAAGYINGTGASTMSPDATITREQAIAVVGRVAGLTGGGADTSVLDQAADGASVSSWARGNVAEALNAGFITGSSGRINPGSGITRAEAVVLLDRVRTDSRVYSFAGTFGPQSGTQTVAGDVTIAAPGVTLQNFAVGGDLTVASGVGEGEASIKNVSVSGDAYIEGGGANSLYVADFRVEGSLIVRKYEGENKVRIVVSGACNFDAVVLETGAVLVTQQLADGVKISVEIPADYLAGSDFEFIGDFDNIVNNGQNTDITVTGSVNKLTLNGSAKVSGDGKIVTAEVSAEAGKETSFETAPVSTTGDGKGDVQLPSGGGTGGTGGGYTPSNPSTPAEPEYKAVVSVAALTDSVGHNEEYTLPANVTAALDDNSEKSFAATWTPSAADTSTCGTFEYEGTLTMVDGYENPNVVKAKLMLTVVPVLTSIEVTQQPAKTLYTVGEELDITGLAVTGTYSDTSKAPLAVTAGNITGFDSETAGEQTLTVDIDGKTDTFDVAVYAAVEGGNLVSITVSAAVSVANGTALNLPSRVEITLEGDSTALADVEWDVESSSYDPETKTVQTFTVDGDVTLPEGITNTDEILLTVQISVTVEAAKYTVSFNLNGQTGASIPSQTIEHGANAVEPEEPESISHDFIGWFAEDAEVAWEFESDTVTEDAVLYAKWQIKTYTISFEVGDAEWETAELPDDIEAVEHGTAAAQPEAPELAGYTFGGWYTDGTLETAYNWSAPVTESFTLYAKFADTLTFAADALTFELIKGANTSEQSITANLALLTSMTAHPGVAITWSSSNTEVIATDGTVTRPEDADAEVTLTATLELGGGQKTKTFDLMVRISGIADVVVEGADDRFAPEYPKVSFDNEGKATLRIQLDEGVASEEHPVWAYLVFDSNTSSYYTLDKESILYGHSVSVAEQDGKHNVAIPSAINELKITDDSEFICSEDILYNWTNEYKIGVVLLADDNINDPLAAATVIKLTAEQISYVDITPPNNMNPFLSEDGRTIYAYFDEKLSTAIGNKPAPSDFTLNGTGTSGITVTAVAISNDDVDYAGYVGMLSGCVTLTLSESITEKSYLALTYTPGTNKLADANSNTVENQISDAYVNTTAPSAKAYINPTAGTMMVHFEPGLHFWQEYNNFTLIGSAAALKYNSSAVTLESNIADGMWSGVETNIKYTFEPLPAEGTYSASQFAFSVASGLTLFNTETIVVNGQAVESVQPQITADGVAAEYDAANSRIKLTFPIEVQFSSSYFSAVACAFTLMADEQRLLYRDAAYPVYQWEESYQANIVYMPLTNRLKTAIESGSTVTVSYSPDEHIKQVYTHLSDISGAFFPAFGPITVTMPGG